jgi:diazepam-binding inhibitor (GABA receptor modulating acyl-CoA-binding protein)
MTSSKDITFEQAGELMKTLKRRPNEDELLTMYGLFKQATIGDINVEKPPYVDFESRRKWDVWKGFEGMSKERARKEYVEAYLELT